MKNSAMVGSLSASPALRDISPNWRYLSTFLSGLCTPLFGTPFILSMKGVSSSGCVSGTVHTGGASLSSGLGIMRDLDEVVHWPLTRLVTAWGSGEEPSERGSSVAQDGRLERQRRLLRRRAAAAADDEEDRSFLQESILSIGLLVEEVEVH